MADFQSLRKEYTIRGLNENEVAPDPISQFLVWFDEACSAGLREPNAMTLATVDAQGHPSARIMLLKGFDQRGFVWFTNYESRKGHELAQNPYAALVFFWVDLERQVRIEGLVRPVAADESDAYFQSRPRGSQIGAWVSPQSTVIASRSAIEERLAAVEARYATQEPERPPYWGGYRLTPRSVEFWQGRPNRLHDRLRYRRGSDNWIIERLAP